MSLKSICSKIPPLKTDKKSKIRHQIVHVIHKLYMQGHPVETPRDLVNYINTNHIDTSTLDLPYDYTILRQDILSGKYDVENILPNFDHQELKRAINHGKSPNWHISR